jgi:hypothetical protein
MAVQRKTSDRATQSSLSASLKGRPITYISETDPRNDPQYLKDHPGQIIVLSTAEFLKYLKTQASGGLGGTSNAPDLNDNESNTLYGTVDTTIHPPLNLFVDNTQTMTVETDTGTFFNMLVNFDLSPDDPLDGTFEYHVSYEPGTISPSVTPSAKTAATTKKAVSPTTKTTTVNGQSVTTTEYISAVGTPSVSTISVKWKALANAQYYNVRVVGVNCPGTSGQQSVSYLKVNSSSDSKSYTNSTVHGTRAGHLSSGYYTFTLNQTNGKHFVGSYTFSVTATYSNGTTSGAVTSDAINVYI